MRVVIPSHAPFAHQRLAPEQSPNEALRRLRRSITTCRLPRNRAETLGEALDCERRSASGHQRDGELQFPGPHDTQLQPSDGR